MIAKHYKHLLLSTILCFFLSNTGSAQGPIAANYINTESFGIKFSSQEISNQINGLPDPLVRPHFDPVIASYIKTYTVKSRERTEKMLGKMQLYFPIFEKHLAEAEMPLSLKYVPVLESALNPMATSRSGAAGLWQIMPITAKDMKLRVSRYVDDRRDVEKSTKAAVAYLKKLYRRFGSWELALAAYNGGPGRVSRLMRRTGISDFWKLRKHLPRETRNYISAFLSANYISNYYYLYELVPEDLNQRIFSTQYIEVNDLTRFEDIAAIAGMEVEQIQAMNPRYARGYVPANSKGQALKLPLLEAAILKNRLGESGYSAASVSNLQRLTYEVQPTDNFFQICADLKCSPAEVARWNGMKSIALSQGQLITYFIPEKKRSIRKSYTLPALLNSRNFRNPFDSPLRPIDSVDKIEVDNFVFFNSRLTKSSIIIQGKQKLYRVLAGESLLDISKKIPNTSLEELMLLNKLSQYSNLHPGQLLLVK